MLLGSALASASLKLGSEFTSLVTRWSPPFAWPSTGALRDSGVTTIGLKQLGFSLEPSLLMVGFGAIIGLRAGVSLLLGAVIGWLLLAPWVLDNGWARKRAPPTRPGSRRWSNGCCGRGSR